MKIVSTGIPDVYVDNIDKSKLDLANKIIKIIYPLLDDIYSEKQNNAISLKREFERKTFQVSNEKDNLEKLVINYNQQKKINKLLERLSILVSSGIANSGSYRHETVVLLKVIDTLSNDKLDYHLSETIKTINKRFSVSL